MKTLSKLTLLVILSLFLINSVHSQAWLNSPYLDNSKENLNFYDVQNAFNTWAEGKDLSKTKGIKQFKRWEWFYESRVYPTGNIPNSKIYWEESQKFHLNNREITSNSNWTSLSPANVPQPYDTLNIIGMGRINSITFHPTDINIIWIGSSSGGVWKTTDNGSTWTCLTDMIPVLRVSDVAVDPNNTDILYISTGDINTIMLGGGSNQGIGVLKSTDGGASWNTTGLSFNLIDGNSSLIRKVLINPANSDELLATGYDGIYKSYNAGTNWTKIDDNTIVDVKVNPLDNNILYATSYYNASNTTSQRIYKSYDFGSTWIELNTGIPTGGTVLRLELAIAPSDTSYIYAIACGTNNGLYAIYKSTDAGQNWFVVGAVDTTIHPGAAEIPNLLGWVDGGKSGFTPDSIGQGTYDLTLIVDPDNKDLLYSGGVNMWGSDDGGSTWDIVSMWYGLFGASVHADQHYSMFHPITGKFYQAHDGGIDVTDSLIIGDLDYVYLNCVNWAAVLAGDIANALYPNCYFLPTQWTNISSGLHITEYYRLGLCASNPDIIVGGSQDNGTYLYNSGSWVNTLGGDGMEAMIAFDNDSIIYATNYNGALSRSDDGGVTYVSSLELAITDTAGESGAWVTPFAMHSVNSDIIYAGFENVWKSPDKGVTWNQISNISGSATLIALAIAPNALDSTIYCAQVTNIYRTTNGGTNWTNIKTGLPYLTAHMTYIAVDNQDSEKLWVTFSGYEDGEKVYVSEDGGDTWTNISDGLPNVPLNCVVHETGTSGITGAVYVGTDIGVYYTNDSLQATTTKWLDYNINLPNVVVSELEIHYGASKLRAATYGRGLWETPLYVIGSGVENNISNNSIDLKIYPNPSNGIFTITANVKTKQNVEINIFSLKGDKLMTVYDKADKRFKREIDISEMVTGTYIIQTIIGDSNYTTKIVKD